MQNHFKPLNANLALWLARRAVLQPLRESIVYWHEADSAENWTYQSLDQAAGRLAGWMKSQGVQPGDRVAFLDLNDVRFAIVMFAAARIGAIFVPLNFRLSQAEIISTLSDCKPKILIYGNGHERVCQSVLQQGEIVGLCSCREGQDEFWQATQYSPSEDELVQVDWDDIAWLLYTSGSTGVPKGVALSHGNIFWNALNIILIQGGFSTDKVLISAPLFHAAPVATFMESFLRGATIHLERSFDPKRLLQRIDSEKIQIVAGVPAMYKIMAADDAFEKADLSHLRAVIVGGAPVPEALIKTYKQRGVTVIQRYGLTEAAPLVTALPWESAPDKQMSAGLPPVFGDLRLVTEDGALASTGQIGEIQATGPNIMAGYWGREKETRHVLSEDGWLSTGDLGVMDGDGYLTVVGRKKDMIISGGENVYATEVESRLAENQDVLECAVIGLPDEKWGEIVCAVISIKPGRKTSGEQVLASLQGRLARYKQPKKIIFMDSLPKNGAGKLDKLKLKTMLVESVESV